MGTRKIIAIPSRGEKLGEFLGICLGDGGIRNDYQLTVSYNYKNEHSYARYVEKLIWALFRLRVTKRVRPEYGSADLVINSRALVQFLGKQGLKKGDKLLQKVVFPAWISARRKTRQGALRGFFDTDGCVFRHQYRVNNRRYEYMKLAFTSYSNALRKQIERLLQREGFHPSDYRNRVWIYSQDEALRYWGLIGTRNDWHSKRFRMFSKKTRRGARARFNRAVC